MSTFRAGLSVVLGLVLVPLLPLGCQSQVLEPRSRFVEDGVRLEAPDVWSGEAIVVETSGVTPAGGLSLSAGDQDRVYASARMLALADTTDKRSADQAVDAVKKSTYAVTTSDGATLVRCGIVGVFGSVAAGDAGCDALEVTFPRGAADRPLVVTARSAQGLLAGSFASATLRSLELYGRSGRIEITSSATSNATILIVEETGGDVVLRLPPDFAADALVLEAPAASIDTTAFPDLLPGAVGRGELGRGAKSITVRAGRIVLALPR
jgi:hypothetical protein